MSAGRFLVLTALLFLLLIVVALVSLGFGAVSIPLAQFPRALGLDPEAPDEAIQAILWQLRLPRILLSALVGAALAGAGAAYQGLFRNPLADPFVIGAASGAALGATLALGLGFGGRSGSTLCAFLGALAAVSVVYLLGALGTRSSAVTLLLAGAAVSTVFGSAVSLLMLLNDQSLQVIFTWLLGGFSAATWPQLTYGAPTILLGLLWITLLARPLDALALGEESAQSLGLPVLRTRFAIVLAATLTTAVAVSLAGIIGFVGLIAPHTARLLFGAPHARLIPASCLLGGLLMVLADDAARTVASPLEIPVGIVTSLVGGPFFLYLLKTRRGWGAER